MTTDNGIEMADVMDELATQTVAQLQRDVSIPEGTVLAESEFEGQIIREVKNNSMVRRGKQQLPERFAAFDKYGVQSMLPTAQMGRMLSKERADSPGERAFHTHTKGMTRDTCSICPAMKAPIDALCNICPGARGMKPTFMSEEQLISHKRVMHSLEYATENETLDRAERRAALEVQQRIAESQERLAEAMLANAAPAQKKG